jgi:Domain of unknown function (DUF5658)
MTTRRIVETAAFALVVLNLLDAVFTLVWIKSGVASEGNPFMDRAMAHGPVGFMVIKLALVSLSVLLLWRLRHRRAAATALVATAIAYASILCLHLSAAVPSLVATMH